MVELSGGQIVTAAYAMQNLHLINKELSGAARPLPLPKTQGTFQSMSLIPSQTRELLACSFCSPHSIYIYTLQENALEHVQSITPDFDPFRGVWLQTLKTFLVFDYNQSNRAPSIFIKLKSERIQELQMDDAIQVRSICRLKGKEKVGKDIVILYDDISKSLLEFELS